MGGWKCPGIACSGRLVMHQLGEGAGGNGVEVVALFQAPVAKGNAVVCGRLLTAVRIRALSFGPRMKGGERGSRLLRESR